VALSVRKIDKSYGHQPVLRGVSFDIEPSAAVLLTGASGSGKTTLLRIMAGLEEPDSGEVVIDGSTATGPNTFLPPHERRIGMVFQQPALWPHLSVYRNLSFAMGRTSREERTKRIAALSGSCGIAELLDRQPASLSAGQAHRVALARAMACQPSYLLLDEPTSNLDSDARDQLNQALRAFVEHHQIGLLYVTHDPANITQIGGRHLHLEDGIIDTIL
jgi:iron(III) transport system ATP-binding protein